MRYRATSEVYQKRVCELSIVGLSHVGRVESPPARRLAVVVHSAPVKARTSPVKAVLGKTLFCFLAGLTTQ